MVLVVLINHTHHPVATVYLHGVVFLAIASYNYVCGSRPPNYGNYESDF